MRAVKKVLFLAVLLMIYVMAGSILLWQFHTYQKAYTALSMLIAHNSIEMAERWEEE